MRSPLTSFWEENACQIHKESKDEKMKSCGSTDSRKRKEKTTERSNREIREKIIMIGIHTDVQHFLDRGIIS